MAYLKKEQMDMQEHDLSSLSGETLVDYVLTLHLSLSFGQSEMSWCICCSFRLILDHACVFDYYKDDS